MRILFTNWAPIVEYGMALGFKCIGWDVDFLTPDKGYNDLELAVQYVQTTKPDLMMTDGGVGRTDFIRELYEKTGVFHIYWAIEDPVSSNLSLDYGEFSCIVLTTCVEWIDEVYKPNHVNAICVPFACEPSYHRRNTINPNLAHELAFVGNNYEAHSYRQEGYKVMFLPFFKNGIDIAFYGSNAWLGSPNHSFKVPPHMYKGYLANNDFPALCASSKFVLGVHSIGTSKTMLAMRTFEVLGSGGFFLTHWSPAIEFMFENHKHLVWSKSADETLEHYYYYKAHSEKAETIRRQGQEFVYHHHTYQHRAEQILKSLPQHVKTKIGF